MLKYFFKEIIFDGLLGETKYYAIRIEFQVRGSPYVHSFIWIFNAPNIENEATYIEFIEKTINAQLPDYLNDPELFELVKTYQIYAGNTIRMNVASHMVDILLRKQLLQNNLTVNLTMLKNKRF